MENDFRLLTGIRARLIYKKYARMATVNMQSAKQRYNNVKAPTLGCLGHCSILWPWRNAELFLFLLGMELSIREYV